MTLIPALQKLAETVEIVICSQTGGTIFHAGKSSPDDISASAAVLVQKLTDTGNTVGFGALSNIVVQGQTTSVIVPREEKIANVIVSSKTDGHQIISALNSEKWTFPISKRISKPISKLKPKLKPSSSLPPSSSTATGEKSSAPLISGARPKGFGATTAKLSASTPKSAAPPEKHVVPPPFVKTKTLTAKGTPPPVSHESAQTSPKKSGTQAETMPSPKAARKKLRNVSIPATPAARIMESIRMSLFSGDLADMNSQKQKMVECNLFNEKQQMEQFTGNLDVLCSEIIKLLSNSSTAKTELDSFLASSSTMNNSIQWGALIWQTRVYLSLGKIDDAEESVRAAYHLSHEFDSASRVATRCTIAEVYMMGNKLEQALKVIQTSKSIVNRNRFALLTAALSLTEAQLLAIKKAYNKSNDAAQRALETLPHSPYPKLFLARLAIFNKKFDEAKQLYDEILVSNSKQPDALSDMQILTAVMEGTVSIEIVETYFNLREMAPTHSRIVRLKEVLAQASGFQQLQNLLVWRLLGKGDFITSQLLHHPDKSSRHANRFKPNIVIGYGSSAIIIARYMEVDDYMETMSRDKTVGLQAPGSQLISDTPAPCLSLPPESILEMVESDISGKLFSGELDAFSMPDLLEFLRNGKRTGTLMCSCQGGVGAIEMIDGFLCCAIVPNVDNIGTLLLARGKITKERLARAIEAQEKDISGAKIGAILAEKGLVDPESIKEALVEQTFSAIRTMLEWTGGRFLFSPSNPNESPNRKLEIKLDIQFVMMEVFRKMDEENRDNGK